jgi:hypothetical protein
MCRRCAIPRPPGMLALLALILLVFPASPARPAADGTEAAAPPRLQAALADPAMAQQPTETPPPSGVGAQIKAKQRREMLKADFEKMKRDAEEMASLAKAVQEELDKSNENVLSIEIVEKAEKIEKLAKRIKNTARGY